ncbi:MAG: ATP-binding protein [Candidatus Dojkabacteria bacterium]|nr:ATP-binding protein [Candidatus Dojkabacteria bacterium]
MDLVDYFNILVGLVSLPIVFLFIFRKPRKRVNIAYGLFALQGPLWSFTITLFRQSRNVNEAWAAAIALYTVGSLVAPLFLYFSIFFLKRKVKFIETLLCWLPFIVFIIFIVVSRLFIQDVTINDQGNHVTLGPLYIPWVIWFTVIMGLSLITLVRSYQKMSGILRSQITFILVSILLPMAMSFPFNLILPFFGNYELVWVGPSSIIFMSGIIAYAIVRHRFLGTKFLIGQLLYFILSVLSNLVLIYTFFVLAVRIHQESLATVLIVLISTSLIYLVLYKQIDKYLRSLLEKALIYSEYNPYDVINKLLKITSTELNLERVVLAVLGVVKSAFEVERSGLVIFDKSSRKILYKRLTGFDEKAQRNMRDLLEVVSFWDYQERGGQVSEILVYEEVVATLRERDAEEVRYIKKIIKFMEEEDIAVLLPLNRKVQLNGLLLVGNKDQLESFTVQDINLLESIIANASVAVGRALLYKEVQEFAINLEKKVDRATVQLRDKIEALEEARRREQDMVDILGHELRTPMSIIKSGFGFLGMLSKHKVYPNVDNETKDKIKKYHARVDENIEREIKLIDTLLGATKIDKGKLDLKLESVDIIDVVEDGLLGQRAFAQRKGLNLEFIKPEEWEKYPRVLADRARIQEVMDNLLSNAVKYTFEGSIKVEIEHDDEFVTIHISDTGIGIPEDAQRNLGKKFYRVEQYTDESKERDLKMVRSGGTGLGLYVTYGIVEAQGGRIWVDSEVGRGTTFHFTVPIHKAATQAEEDGYERDVFKRHGLAQEEQGNN